MRATLAFAAGLVFALGLGGLAQPARVLGFLDVFGAWDPALAWAMAGAVTTYTPLRPSIMHRPRPVLGTSLAVPSRTDIVAPLIGGAVLFGLGWGLVGYCRDPAFVALDAAVPEGAIFVGAMMAGMLLFTWRRTPA